MHSMYATFIRNWIITWRAYPWNFFLGVLFSSLTTVGIAYFTFTVAANREIGPSFVEYTQTSSYLNYIILGAAGYLLTIRVLLGVSRSLIMEQREGTLDGLLLTPSRRISYLLGVTAQWVMASLVEVCVLLLLIAPLGLDLSSVHPWTLLLAIPVGLLSIFGMSIVLGGVMLATGDTFVVQNTLFVLLGLLCGFSFPVAYLPLPLQYVSFALPPTHALSLLRAAMLQHTSPGAIQTEIGYAMLMGLGYTIAGLRLITWAERRVQERGG